jgi:hypothetical protein
MWWINTEFFLESFSQLVKSIPNVQILILLINIHVNLVTPNILKRASENNTRLVACPSHISQHSSGGMSFTYISFVTKRRLWILKISEVGLQRTVK